MTTFSHNLYPQNVEPTFRSFAHLKEVIESVGKFLDTIGRKSVRNLIYFLLFVGLLIPGLMLIIYLIFRAKKSTKELDRVIPILDQNLEKARQLLAQGDNPYQIIDQFYPDPKSYAEFQRIQRVLKPIDENVLPKAKKLSASWLQIFFRPMSIFLEKAKTYKDKLSELLSLYDEETNDGAYFKKIGKRELWDSRNSAYEYLV